MAGLAKGVAVLLSTALHAPPQQPANVNLRVADARGRARPAISEFQVVIQNLGEAAGEGVVTMLLVDTAGRGLFALELAEDARLVRVPAISLGGAEGRTVSTVPSLALRALIDSLETTGTGYGLRVTVETVSNEADWSDNVKIIESHGQSVLAAGRRRRFSFLFLNQDTSTWSGRWRFEALAVPVGAKVSTSVTTGSLVSLQAGASTTITLEVEAPNELAHGAIFAGRVSLLDASTGWVLQQHEWYAVRDTVPPIMTNYRALLLSDGSVLVQVFVDDAHSEVHPHRVTSLYSTDAGATWQRRRHDPVETTAGVTVFETSLGRLPRGGDLLLAAEAYDLAGNVQRRLPDDATVLLAPANAERFLRSACCASLNRSSVLFEFEELASLDRASSSSTLSRRQRQAPDGLGDNFDRRRLLQVRTVLDAARDLGLRFDAFEREPAERTATEIADSKFTTLRARIP